MAVYVDDMNLIAVVPNGSRTISGVWCHMVADSRAELDFMAQRIGLNPAWIQCAGTWKEHYDVTSSRRKRAVTAGAIEVTMLNMARMLEARKINSEIPLKPLSVPSGDDLTLF